MKIATDRPFCVHVLPDKKLPFDLYFAFTKNEIKIFLNTKNVLAWLATSFNNAYRSSRN